MLAATIAEISRKSQIFLDAPIVPTPANFGPKHCFLYATTQTQVMYQIWSS